MEKLNQSFDALIQEIDKKLYQINVLQRENTLRLLQLTLKKVEGK